MIKKIYFAHPITDYNTEYEEDCIKAIKKMYESQFLDLQIVNPNSPEHEAYYSQYGMGYFIGLARGCDITVAVPFRDGAFGAGVAKELMASNLKLILEDGEFRSGVNILDEKILTIQETRDRIEEHRRKNANVS